MEIYGTAVADKLDNDRGLLRRRYYRQHCTLDFGSYTKDLSAICADLSSIFILDNSPGAYRSYPGEIEFVKELVSGVFASENRLPHSAFSQKKCTRVLLALVSFPFQIMQFLSSLGLTTHQTLLCSICYQF